MSQKWNCYWCEVLLRAVIESYRLTLDNGLLSDTIWQINRTKVFYVERQLLTWCDDLSLVRHTEQLLRNPGTRTPKTKIAGCHPPDCCWPNHINAAVTCAIFRILPPATWIRIASCSTIQCTSQKSVLSDKMYFVSSLYNICLRQYEMHGVRWSGTN